ncbi:FadR family transcriptional regulator [Rhodococcus sp. ABRD24]|uniref:FadR/GntR family transcriptional regulator n=1 Tax=Rhodococcus sp. ABRD24 TaxID=2507582 RepID=UPI00103F20C3|nr:GntR family transcriptional regulator [Rhodococcus sp. ABRD24]QBJ96002.1 FadR family transcriptional regulator [Rhodococcus sp. ABRD24]
MTTGASPTSDRLRQVLLAPIDAGGRTQVIFQRLQTAIALDVFKDGEQLPPEIDLAAQLGVSPVTLREALSLLRETGLVETKRGRSGGTFVRRKAYKPSVHGRQQLLQMSPVELRDLSDWKTSLAEAATFLAAERSTDDEVDDLDRRAEQLAAATTSASARRAEGRMFIAIATASQSVRLTRAAVAVLTEHGPLLSVAFESDTLRKEVATAYSEVCSAIRDGDRETATTAVRDGSTKVAVALAEIAAELRRPARR